MACGKCGQKNCSCGSGGSQEQAQLAAQFQDLQVTVDQLATAIAPFKDGHPILLIEHPDDVSLFDLGTGAGFGRWNGWGICNGNAYPNSALNKNITTPDLRDKVPVGAGGAYAVDDEFGADKINLVTAQLPAHSHGVTDAGHTHVVTDPGHDHPITDPEHTHGAAGSPHTHTLSINNSGDHNHSVPEIVDAISNGGTGATAANSPVTYGNSGNAGIHTHTGVADATAVAITVQAAATGIDVTNSFAGITVVSATTGIVIQNTGAAADIDIRQKSCAVFFAMKIE